MNLQALQVYQDVQNRIQQINLNEFLLGNEDNNERFDKQLKEIVAERIKSEDPTTQERVTLELESWGPLQSLLENPQITEILVNGHRSIWYEISGKLTLHEDGFFSELSYRNFLDRLSSQAQAYLSLERPIASGVFNNFRLTMTGSELTGKEVQISLRRHPENPWTLEKLAESNWASSEKMNQLKEIIRSKENFLVVGGTGTGKTSVLNALLGLLPTTERVVVIEDTSEIHLPNAACTKLLTRDDPHQILAMIDQSQLVKHALRLRPDRIAMGEVRGAEAKDFLMAMATGHAGSFGTLHAQDPHQALIRLEMLIQMGAPQWGLEAIRRLIHLSLQFIIQIQKGPDGSRFLKGIYKITSLEPHGFLLEEF